MSHTFTHAEIQQIISNATLSYTGGYNAPDISLAQCVVDVMMDNIKKTGKGE